MKPSLTRKITIKEVAQEAGVSTQTVSRVINHRPDVAPETRETVQAVIDRLGYQPNAIARSLIRQRSQTLGVVIAALNYYGPVRTLTAIERAANNLGYSLVLSLVHDFEHDRGEQALAELLGRQVDGIIWAMAEIDDNRAWLQEKIPQLPVPILFIGTPPYGNASVMTASRIAGRFAAEHLVKQGFQKIGLISGPLNWKVAQDRKLGWLDVLPKASPRAIFEGDWSAASGEQGLRQLLTQFPKLDALYASNDQMALGVLQAAHQMGLRVPEDLGLVGTDNIPEAAYFWPPLTTIRFRLVESTRLAVEQLHQLIETQEYYQEAIPLRDKRFDPELIVRKSSVRSRFSYQLPARF